MNREPGSSDILALAQQVAAPSLIPGVSLSASDTDPAEGRSAFGWSDSSTPLRISLQQNLSANDTLLELEISTDMQTWTPADTAVDLISRTNNGDGTATLLYEQTGTPQQRLFVRARAALR